MDCFRVTLFLAAPQEGTRERNTHMKMGEVESAERRALNLFDRWNDVTGFVSRQTSYYYEIQGVIKDAVHCGIQEALGIFKSLDGEE